MRQSIKPTIADTVDNDIVATVDQALQHLSICGKRFSENEIQDILLYLKWLRECLTSIRIKRVLMYCLCIFKEN